uniref:Uncharacterized protein n=1 Tax=Picea glauca TaxID=3330 RepID=A0A101LV58_PICGL|nr:hypothetical protein ABT39_MTgene2045 [Picea glauca]QHR89636.1 hypothetical protein Q903MT_gene3658 [Picea sitchensis]
MQANGVACIPVAPRLGRGGAHGLDWPSPPCLPLLGLTPISPLVWRQKMKLLQPPRRRRSGQEQRRLGFTATNAEFVS